MKICIIRFIGKIMMTIILLWPPDNTLSLDQSSSNFLILIYGLYVRPALCSCCCIVCSVDGCNIDKVGFRKRFQLINYRLSIRNLNCLGNHLIPPPPPPTHINFTWLLPSSLWSDLSMWGHYLIVLSLRNSNFTSARVTERGIAH